MIVRVGVEADARAAATLHASQIAEGFLSSLGVPFLSLLYRRVVRWPRSFLLVASSEHDETDVVGVLGAAEDTGALYKTFLVHDGVRATARNAPRLLRSIGRIVETLRYPAQTEDDELPEAEILSVAVAAHAHGRGIGRALLDAAVAEFASRGIDRVKVVTTAGNEPARRLYASAGFEIARDVTVHAGTRSVVFAGP